jgi:hypothetical protein
MRRQLRAIAVAIAGSGLVVAVHAQVTPPAARQKSEVAAAIKDFLVSLADTVGDTACQLIHVHPDVGDSLYSHVVLRQKTWRVVYRLPVRNGEVVRRAGREFVFTPPILDRPSAACLGYAALVPASRATADSMLLAVEILRRSKHRLGHWLTALAMGRRTDGLWRFKLERVVD